MVTPSIRRKTSTTANADPLVAVDERVVLNEAFGGAPPPMDERVVVAGLRAVQG